MLIILQVWTAGQVVGLINDIPTCADLVSRIEREAVESLKKAQSLIVDEKDIPAKL
jgi:NAD(P)H-dependent flavin oxidoreductase YrpB (nitropropane dioxygenase family)